MIPTMIVFGLVLGRWWRVSLIAGTLAWPVLLWTDGTINAPEEILGAAVLGLANTLVGVAVHQLALRSWRAVRKRSRSSIAHHT